MDEPHPVEASSSASSRWHLIRDVAVFQLKLGLDALRDLVLSPISLIAGIVDLVFGGELADLERPVGDALDEKLAPALVEELGVRPDPLGAGRLQRRGGRDRSRGCLCGSRLRRGNGRRGHGLAGC
jgi:hypothetical protein